MKPKHASVEKCQTMSKTVKHHNPMPFLNSSLEFIRGHRVVKM